MRFPVTIDTALGKNLDLINGNSTTIAAVNTSSVIGDDKGTHYTDIYVVKGAGAIPTTYIPVVAIRDESSLSDYDVSVIVERDDSPYFFGAVQDSGANNRTLNWNLGGCTTFSIRHFTDLGVTIETQTGNLTHKGSELFTFANMKKGHYIAVSVTGDDMATPAATEYNFSRLICGDVGYVRSSPSNIGRVIDLIRAPTFTPAMTSSFFVENVIRGFKEVRKINSYLTAYSATGSIISIVDAYYQTIQTAADTAANVDERCLKAEWWLTKTGGISPYTKGKLYEMWYEVAKDNLNLARCNAEFADYVLHGP